MYIREASNEKDEYDKIESFTLSQKGRGYHISMLRSFRERETETGGDRKGREEKRERQNN
jgi:hypothetical protein